MGGWVGGCVGGGEEDWSGAASLSTLAAAPFLLSRLPVACNLHALPLNPLLLVFTPPPPVPPHPPTLLQLIKTCLGPLPFFKDTLTEEEAAALEAPVTSIQAPIQKVRPVVLADGSYATQTALPGEVERAAAAAAAVGAAKDNVPNLR